MAGLVQQLIYEPQLHLPGSRTCGAAALCMAYRMLGLEVSQANIWRRLTAGRAPRGGATARSLALDALSQGLSALVVQAEEPWALLQTCAANGLPVIVNHRLTARSPWGHFSLLCDIDDKSACLHDPQIGPQRSISRCELLELWQGCFGRTEIAGQVAVVLGPAGLKQRDCPQTCPHCRHLLPAEHQCPLCRRAYLLHPTAALGCLSPECPARLWRRHFCPHCDAGT